jgi:hypothetical protein
VRDSGLEKRPRSTVREGILLLQRRQTDGQNQIIVKKRTTMRKSKAKETAARKAKTKTTKKKAKEEMRMNLLPKMTKMMMKKKQRKAILDRHRQMYPHVLTSLDRYPEPLALHQHLPQIALGTNSLS